MPLRFLTVLFQYEAVLSYSAAFRSHSLAHLLRAAPFLHISVLFFSIASPLPTVLALIRSARFHSSSIQCFSLPTHYISWLCLCFSKPSYAFSFLCYSRQLHASAKPNISAAMHFFSLPSPFEADQCHHISMRCFSISLLNVTSPSPNNAIPMRLKADLFLRVANQCHYLKIVVGLWLISCQTKAPLPELRHCPRPLNRP